MLLSAISAKHDSNDARLESNWNFLRFLLADMERKSAWLSAMVPLLADPTTSSFAFEI